jgi:glyoxylase-like metal-dependent hydrolase (beta-lactamase superfamily II)
VALTVDKIEVGLLATNCYLVGDSETRETFIVDPGADVEILLDRISAAGWEITAVVLTHAHFDHVLAAGEIVNELGVPLLASAPEAIVLTHAPDVARRWLGVEVPPPPAPDRILTSGDTLTVGTATFRVADTPGHSPGGITLIGDDRAFVGDTIFAGSVGRADLPGGDFDQLMASIRDEILTLPDETVLHCGHGPDTTVGEERRTNPFILQMLDG